MSLSVEKVLRKAQSHMKAGELAEAEELYKQVLTKFPKNKKAIQGYQKLKAGITLKGSLNSEPPTEQIDELINLYNQGRFEEVLAKAKHLIDLFPKEVTLHNIQGVSNAALQRYDAAIDSYRQAIKINPYYPDSYSNMGSALKGKGYLDAAIDSYKQALKIKPDYAEAYYNMGISLHEKDDLDAAIKSYKQALKIKPNYAECYSNLGVALKDEGNLGAAIDSFKQALKIKPDYAESFVNNETIQVQISGVNYIDSEFKSLGNESLKALLFENPKHQILQSINYFLKGENESSARYLQRYKLLSDLGATKNLLKKDQVFLNAYVRFIEFLIKKNSTSPSLNTNKIFHVGESHCLSYAHQNLTIKKQTFCISPVITFGAKAYHFSQPKENAYKAITKHNLDAIPNSSFVAVSIGEIDCRAYEGLIQASQKTGAPMEELVQKTVNGYVAWFLAANLDNKHTYKFFNVPAPVYKKEMASNINQKVADVVSIFNWFLRKTSADHSLDLLDVYESTRGENGFSNNLYHCDDTHLDGRILGIVEEQLNK